MIKAERYSGLEQINERRTVGTTPPSRGEMSSRERLRKTIGSSVELGPIARRKNSSDIRSKLIRALHITTDDTYETPLMKKLNDKKKKILNQIVHIERRIGQLEQV